MAAFRGAVEVGATALEADIHLSKDGVVVFSHVRDAEPREVRPHNRPATDSPIGRHSETLLWPESKDFRMRLELSEHPAYHTRAETTDASLH
jgi:glycerophosphoryl diester phosphodiesterase